MHRLHAVRIALPAIVLTIGVSCADDQSVIIPEFIVIQAGDNQSGVSGERLAVPLEVAVTGNDGRPYSGATVRWSVVSGDAQVDPASSDTDVDGFASTTVTLGAQEGAVQISASVEGIAAVAFNAMNVACVTSAPLVLGSPVVTTLDPNDCWRAGGARRDNYTFTLDQPASLLFTQTSNEFDPFLVLSRASGEIIAFNDDITLSDRNSSLRVFLAPGQYVISPSGYSATDLGTYTLTGAVENGPVTGCAFYTVWVVPGVTVNQDLSDADCVLSDQQGNTYYADAYFIQLQRGTTLTVAQTSGDVDTYLELYRLTSAGAEYIGFNDDEGPGSTNSTLTYTVAATGVYLLLPSSARNAEVGAYTLTIQ